MKKVIFVSLAAISSLAHAQKYGTEQSLVTFYSHATIEDISAENRSSSSIFNAATGDVVFVIPIREFHFAKSLMQEHFNEKYMDSEKFPRATFQGKLTGYDLKITGEQSAKAKGKLTVHGVTNEIETTGTVEVREGKIIAKSGFIVKLDDYHVERPKLMWQNIAEQVEVKIEFTYKLL